MATSTGLIGDHGGTSAAMSGHEIRFDGSEIRRSPVEVGGLSHYLAIFFMHPRWLAGLLPMMSIFFGAKRRVIL